MNPGFVYIMANGKNGTIYIGVTSDLVKRVWNIGAAQRKRLADLYPTLF